MPYQETLKEKKWIALLETGWEGEPFKSEVKPDAPAILAAPIRSADWNTLTVAVHDAQALNDFDALTAVPNGVQKRHRHLSKVKDRLN